MRAHYSCWPGGFHRISSISSAEVSRGFRRVFSARTYKLQTRRAPKKNVWPWKVASYALLNIKIKARRLSAELRTIDFYDVFVAQRYKVWFDEVLTTLRGKNNNSKFNENIPSAWKKIIKPANFCKTPEKIGDCTASWWVDQRDGGAQTTQVLLKVLKPEHKW